MRAGDELTLTIERPVAGGRMIARHEGAVVLVGGAVPGELVRARVERVSRQVAWAETTEVIEPSADRRTDGPDRHCGGAAYAHIAYPRQLTLKGEVIADAFRRIGRRPLDPPAVAGSPEDGYRLRARLHVRQRRAGFFREHSHDLCDAAATTQLLPATIAAVSATLVALDSRIADCDAFVVSENAAANDRVLHVEPREGVRLADMAGLPLPDGLTGLTTGRPGRGVTVLAGRATITDTAADLRSETAPPTLQWMRGVTSFFQGNRFLTGALVDRVLARAEGDWFVDLYAGVGLFAAAMAARGARGLAVEADRASAGDLERNLAPWRRTVRVMHDTVESAVALPLDPPPDVVVVDPPRAGLAPEALHGVIAWRAPRLVYVSCDPATLARDAARLAAAGYALDTIEAFDLFPNTAHVETIASFVLPPNPS
jgi:23S rRNA (uracil1939-C5)-methyltransferase